MRAIFIRHGKSTVHSGEPSIDIHAGPLNTRGENQARQIAREWTERPTLIVTSPFLRAIQTAAPTIERFVDVPVDTWPIEEFAYLEPTRWAEASAAERINHAGRYWATADPSYLDGTGAESFSAFLRRVERTLQRLTALAADDLVYLFGHGQFIEAVRAIVMRGPQDDQTRMRTFWRRGSPPVVPNGERIGFEYHAGRWSGLSDTALPATRTRRRAPRQSRVARQAGAKEVRSAAE